MQTTQVEPAGAASAFAERRRLADRIFRAALIFNAALTLFWIAVYATGRHPFFFEHYRITLAGAGGVLAGLLFFYVIWGFIWWGIKNLLLKYFVGFTKDERRQAFSSRMHAPYDVADLVSRYSERRIRIVDMIGRRGRFIILGAVGFYTLYRQVATQQPANFATAFLTENLFDAVLASWLFLAFYYADNFIAAAYYGPQSRVMDGVLARANCLLITTLWTVFKFVLVPIGSQLARVFPPAEFAPVFGLIWGSYIVADSMAEIGGSLIGKQRLRVFGIGDVNRKSIGGTVTGFAASLAFCVALVLAHGLPAPWLALAVVISCSNSLLELFSPRGTDDFTMATMNALICWGFGGWIL